MEDKKGRPPYGPFVETCKQYGIGRTKAYELADRGLIDTFHIGRKRFVYRQSLNTLPQRIAKVARDPLPFIEGAAQ